ncbi:MAG: SWIM zinc finger family protein, partial [Actinoplanes sp.]
LSLTLSPEPYRGFSGEGAVLEALAGDEVADDADLISVLLSWEPTIDVGALAAAAGIDAARVRAALTQLGTAGRVGYDVAEAGYFHRTLPYSADAVAAMNPRLAAARALAASGAITVEGEIAVVRSGEQTYHVRANACTCPWWARHRGERGPCKHTLAVRLVRSDETAEVPA